MVTYKYIHKVQAGDEEHRFRKTYATEIGEQLLLDLVDMKKYKDNNKGYYWIVTAIDILSRYACAIPVYRNDTKNMEKAVGELLKEFHERFDTYPRLAQFDDGMEFYNVGVKTLLEKHGVKYFSTNSNKKTSVVERFNRTLKTNMWKYFYSKGRYKWIDILQDLVENYNNTEHISILMKPVDVTPENEGEVWMLLFGDDFGDHPEPKFKIGDKVRISKYKRTFTKGYEANFIRGAIHRVKDIPWRPEYVRS